MTDSVPVSSSMSSAEKKRLRDRRAQQKVRERRDEWIKQLQNQVDHCNQVHARHDRRHNWRKPPHDELLDLHRPDGVNAYNRSGHDHTHCDDLFASLSARVQALEQDRELLLADHQRFLSFANTLHSVTANLTESVSTAHATIADAAPARTIPTSLDVAPQFTGLPSPGSGSSNCAAAQMDALANVRMETDVNLSVDMGVNPYRGILSPVQMASPADTAMQHNTDNVHKDHHLRSRAMRPLSTIDDEITKTFMPWLSDPAKVAASPEFPDPATLILGSHDNWLARQIKETLRGHRVAEAERLAGAWIMYVYSKWRITPSEERYARLPHFVRSLMEAQKIPQPAPFDMIVWPRLRQNIFRTIPILSHHEIFYAFTSCLRVRWTWGAETLEPAPEGGYRIRDEFLETFTTDKGWGITPEFIQNHLELFQGMDIASVEFIVA